MAEGRGSRAVAELLELFLPSTRRFAFKQAGRIPPGSATAAAVVRLSTRNERQDQFARYRTYCGFIILFTVILPHGLPAVYFTAHDMTRRSLNPRAHDGGVGSSCIFIELLFRVIRDPPIDAK